MFFFSATFILSDFIHIYFHIYTYIYTDVCGGNFKNKVIQREDINAKESQCHNVSVLMNHYQDIEKMLSSDVRSPMDS